MSFGFCGVWVDIRQNLLCNCVFGNFLVWWFLCFCDLWFWDCFCLFRVLGGRFVICVFGVYVSLGLYLWCGAWFAGGGRCEVGFLGFCECGPEFVVLRI